MKKYLLATLLATIFLPSIAQESIIKDFAEPRRTTRWMNPICLYPSTLRMVNLAQNPNFNEMVNDIEKVLIYTLDSATAASKSYTDLIRNYQAKGFEEYMTMLGKQEMRIIGKKDEYVGIVAAEGNAIAFYLRGDIPFAKIPTLLESFQSSDMLPLLTDQFNFK
ncbi:hypothetical protein [Ekhidna sp.]|uniref:DUF4252 domain-containing protein n=1 Tax=Ekhidna sp. TaxID=2608089 RepID=UPI003299014C